MARIVLGAAATEALVNHLVLNENTILKFSIEGQCDIIDPGKLEDAIVDFFKTYNLKL